MRYQERLTRRIDLMLPISTAMAERAAAYGRPVRVIPDLVDEGDGDAPEPLPPRVAEALAARAPGDRIALYAGRLAPNKGLDLVVEAAARAPGWLVLVAGEDRKGDYGEALRRRAEALGAANVRFVGWVPNAAMAALYDAVDLVLLPFLRAEPLSRGMVEALARGRALAATPHGGPLDGIEEGANGAFFRPTAEGLAGALARLASADLSALGRRSRAIYEDRFRADRVVRAHLEAYEWLLDRGGGAA
jgi:glycosyltransferase involved in cell wall biosynthesis